MCGFDARAFQSGVSVKNRGVAVIPLAAPLNDISPTSNPKHKEMTMPLINVKLIEGVFNETQKRKMVSDLTDAMVAIEGEPLRQFTWVVIEEVNSGNWALGGKPLTTADVKALQARRSAA